MPTASGPSRPSTPRQAGATFPLPRAAPAELGFSPDRLERLHQAMDRSVEGGAYAGYVALLARDGRIADWWAHGCRNALTGEPLAADDLFRIYSMTKLVTSVAVLILMEEGRLRLDDPVGRHLPALSAPKVLAGGTPEAPVLVDAQRAVTLRDLLTHTSGFTYEDNGPAALVPAWRRAEVYAAVELDGFVARAATVPLACQPGTAFHYGISTDLLGAVIEKVSGGSLDAFLAERILEPLGMAETGFWIPEEKRGRLALIHQRGAGGRLALETSFNAEWPTATAGLRKAGGGLFSTAGDYLRFAQMLLGGGQLDGVRVLSRKAVELMTCDHLSALADPHPIGSLSHGFGLGVRVTTDLGQSPTLGSAGAFGWEGMATTLVRIDPRERLVAILLLQHLPFNEGDVFGTFTNGCYAALED